MSDDQDRPVVTLDDVANWVRNILAIVGAAALSAGIGLHHAGFFHWLFSL